MLKMGLSIPTIACKSDRTGQSVLLPRQYIWAVWARWMDGKVVGIALRHRDRSKH